MWSILEVSKSTRINRQIDIYCGLNMHVRQTQKIKILQKFYTFNNHGHKKLKWPNLFAQTLRDIVKVQCLV